MSNLSGIHALDVYLNMVRAGLRGLSKSEVEETLAELRSHVLDRLGGASEPEDIAAALTALGDPVGLAKLNLRERVAARAQTSWSPLAIFGTVAQLAALSLQGLLVFVVSVAGYLFALVCLFAAIAKLFAPTRVGFWRVADPTDDWSFSLSLIARPQPGHEILGWVLVPLGLLLGAGVGWLTYQFGRQSLRQIAGRHWARGT